jgi:hypothetical protein
LRPLVEIFRQILVQEQSAELAALSRAA